MKHRRVTDYQRSRFVAAVAHALPHRHCAASVAGVLIDFHATASIQKRYPFFTQCKIAALRNRLHRNTGRDIIAELKQLGWITVYGYRPRFASRFIVHWSKIWAYCVDHTVRPLTNAIANKPRTKAAWDAERAAHKAARIKAAQTSADRSRANLKAVYQLQRDNAMTPAERKAAAAKLTDLARDKRQDQTAPGDTLDQLRRMRNGNS